MIAHWSVCQKLNYIAKSVRFSNVALHAPEDCIFSLIVINCASLSQWAKSSRVGAEISRLSILCE